MSDKYRYEIEERPCEPCCSNEDAEDWCDIADWEESRGDYYQAQLKETQEQLEALKAENESPAKLLTLADACSDVLLGGECGWQDIEFNDFVDKCRKALVDGARLKGQLESLKAENEKLILEQAQDDYNHDSLLELTRMQERHIQQQAAQFDRAKKKIESLKADKAKVEADKTCTWELDSNAEWEVWETSCGSSWCFEGESDLKEHGVKFCQSCGGRIIDASTLEQKEDK